MVLYAAKVNLRTVKRLIGASMSEPRSSDANGNFLYIYILLLLCVIHRAAYPKLIQFNAHNVYKYV